MKKSELSSHVATQASLSKAQAESVVDAVLSVIGEALARDESAVIAGFGTFTTKTHAARQGRNPRTGETLAIAASRAPSFRRARPCATRCAPRFAMAAPLMTDSVMMVVDAGFRQRRRGKKGPEASGGSADGDRCLPAAASLSTRRADTRVVRSRSRCSRPRHPRLLGASPGRGHTHHRPGRPGASAASVRGTVHARPR